MFKEVRKLFLIFETQLEADVKPLQEKALNHLKDIHEEAQKITQRNIDFAKSIIHTIDNLSQEVQKNQNIQEDKNSLQKFCDHNENFNVSLKKRFEILNNDQNIQGKIQMLRNKFPECWANLPKY